MLISYTDSKICRAFRDKKFVYYFLQIARRSATPEFNNWSRHEVTLFFILELFENYENPLLSMIKKPKF